MINATFINEITDFPTEKITNLGNLIILGDFNIHTEDNTNAENTIFNDPMIAFGFKEHVQGPMHTLGNMLNLIFTQLESEVKVINMTKHGYILDHCIVSNKDDGEVLLLNVNAPTIDYNDSLDQVCHQFNIELLNALDRITPLKTIKYSNKPRQPWFKKYIRDQKKIVRS